MIYICIPSHNEEHTVGVLLWKIRQVLTSFPRDYQLLVLDDGSDDRTPEVLAPYARILPLSVLHHPKRKGYAASLDELLREAVSRSEYPRRDVVVTLQADFTDEPDEIPTLLKRVESGADVVTTRLRIAPARAPRKVRWMRAIATRVLRRLDWPENVTDMLSGFRAYRVVGLRKALEQRNGDRLLVWHDAWAANAALLKAVQPFVRRVDEVEVAFRPDRLQRASRFDAWTTAQELLRLAFGRESGTPVPGRHGGPAVVPAAELAAAADASRARVEAPGQRGRRGQGERPSPAGPRRPARPEADARAPGRGRRERPEREEAPARGGHGGRARAERAQAEERSARGEREHSGRKRGKEAASAGEAVEGIAGVGEGQQAAAAKSRRKRRGAGEAAAEPAGGATQQPPTAATEDGRPALEPGPAEAGPLTTPQGAAVSPLEAAGSDRPAGETGSAEAEARVDAAPPPPALPMQALAPGEDGLGGAGGALQLDLEIPLEGGEAGGEGRRRRRSRRGRGRRGRGAAQETLADTGATELDDLAPVRPGADAVPGAAPAVIEEVSAGATMDVAGAPPPADDNPTEGERPEDLGAIPGSPEADAEDEAAGTSRRRRSRRGGRGRARARRATPEGVAGQPESENAGGEESVGAPEPAAAPVDGHEPSPAGSSTRQEAPAEPHDFDRIAAEIFGRPEAVPPLPPPAFEAVPADAQETPPRPSSPDWMGGAGEQDRSSEMEREQE